MKSIALKMLMGDRAKFFGILMGLTFASLLITQQMAIFIGLMTRTYGFVTDAQLPDIWVMDPKVRFVDDMKPLQETQLYRTRSVEGVEWAVPMYRGFLRARLGGVVPDDGNFQMCIVNGLDDATLIGGPARPDAGDRCAPDSSRVVYRADQVTNDRFELFSVPLDGSASPVKLNPTLPTLGDVTPTSTDDPAFLISPDSTRVVYRADQLFNDRFELFSVPLDGSAASVKLSGTIVSGGDTVGRFEIASDSARVVYVADQLVNDRFEIFTAPIQGGSAPTKVSGPPGSSFLLCPDGTALVYRAFPGIAQLYLAALDGTGTSNLSHLQGEGDVTAYAVVPGSGSVVYIADREDEVYELWLSVFPRAPRASARKL